jgi:predicted ATP-grasp superfamily ATP-dependent carboligase
MLASPYPFFQSLSREITQMQAEYRDMVPLEPGRMKTIVQGLRQKYVPVLTDGAFANQLAIVRGHGREGYMTVVLDPNPKALAFYSRFSIPVFSPDYMKAPADYWEFVLSIGKHIREAGKTPVLTVGDAEWLLDSLVEFETKKLGKVYALNQDYELQCKLQDKYLQYQLGREVDVPMPATWLGDDEFFSTKPDIPFPVLVKERRGKRVFRETGKQAFEATSWDQLNYIKDQLAPDTGIIVQEKISDKGHENMYSIGTFCKKGGQPAALFSSRRLRSTRHYGSTALSVSKPCPGGISIAERYLKHIGYYGSCELEFIYDSQREQLLFLELNNRLYKTQSLATHCGVNLNHFAMLYAIGQPLPELPKQTYGPRWWLAWGDLAAGIRKISTGEMSFGELMEPLSFDFVNGIDELDDPLPGFVNLFNGKF